MTRVSLLFFLLKFTSAQILTQPEQVHLSIGDTPGDLVVTWNTQQSTTNTNSSVVEYGTVGLDLTAYGSQEIFQDDGSEKRKIFIHRVKLTNLKPGQKYFYHVGNPRDGWSEVFWFEALRPDSDWNVRFAVFGDMGNKNAQSLARLQEETQRGHLDAILHVGDFAYDMDSDNSRVGDAFMNQIQSVAAYIPYMTAVGNHEEKYNFSNYKNRFTMPGGDGHGLFYSFDIGKAHVVAFSSEVYYFTQYGKELIAQQYKWLEGDLKKANEPAQRAQRPWIISMCHRPMYCSNLRATDHCLNVQNQIRVGLPGSHAYGMEDLLYKYGVDVHFQAHEHSYERFFPVFNRTVCNGSTEAPYTNPRAPVHMLTGSAGCDEGVSPFEKHPFPWSAYHSDDYGYVRLNVTNATHLYMEQVSDDKGGKVIDALTVIKDKHGAGLYNCN